MEGGSVELAARVTSGHSLYAAPSLAFVGWTYTPLYYSTGHWARSADRATPVGGRAAVAAEPAGVSARRADPTAADRAAGARLIARLRALPGPVIVLRHPWYATPRGKGERSRTRRRSATSCGRQRRGVGAHTPGMRTIRDMTETKDIIASIQNRLRELNDEISALNAARAALDGHASRSPSRPRGTVTRKASAGRSPNANSGSPVEAAVESVGPALPDPGSGPATTLRRRARRRSGAKAVRRDVVPAGKLELLLSDTDGLTTSALAERADGDRDQVLMLLRELEAAGRVRRTGQRRATRWHAISDEERIQQRAAELAAQSRSAA